MKHLGYCEIPNSEILVYKLTVGDLQIEAQERLGRLLNDDEISRAKKILEFSLSETRNPVYDEVFEDLEKQRG
jgi:hypothetical protein